MSLYQLMANWQQKITTHSLLQFLLRHPPTQKLRKYWRWGLQLRTRCCSLLWFLFVLCCLCLFQWTVFGVCIWCSRSQVICSSSRYKCRVMQSIYCSSLRTCRRLRLQKNKMFNIGSETTSLVKSNGYNRL